MRRFIGWVIFASGVWMLISPQSLMGIHELRWMHMYAFSGEALAGMFVLALAYYLLDLSPTNDKE